MRSWIVPLGLCLFFFIIPLHCFIIGGGFGAGIQGAVYRYQITTNGESVIPVTAEIMYVLSGAIKGRTAVSIVLWVLGTIVLTVVTIGSLFFYDHLDERKLVLLSCSAASAGVLFGLSLVVQYGILLSGPGGRSFPFGIVILCIFTISVYRFRNWILEKDTSPSEQTSSVISS